MVLAKLLCEYDTKVQHMQYHFGYLEYCKIKNWGKDVYVHVHVCVCSIKSKISKRLQISISSYKNGQRLVSSGMRNITET